MSAILLPQEAEGAAGWEVSPSGTKVRLTLPMVGGGIGQMVLSAEKLDNLLGGLGLARSAMTPAVAMPNVLHNQVMAVNHPPFDLAGVGDGTDDRMLLILDPRYGATAFRFSPSAAKKIGEALIAGGKAKEV